MTVLFLFFYLSILILPGLTLIQIFRITSLGLLTSIGLSYTVFTLCLITANHYSVPSAQFLICVGFICLTCLAYVAFHKNKFPSLKVCLPFLIIIVISAVYQFIFGAYTEIPADLYAHLERYQAALNNINDGNLGLALSWKNLLLQGSGVFYYLVATANSVTELTAREIVQLVDFANRTIFLLAVFSFAQFIFKEKDNVNAKAYLCVLFVALHMGINVFSYIRYYSFAPTMLAMVVYFSAVSIFINHITRKRELTKTLITLTIIAAMTIAASAVHTQEALFIGIMIACISSIAVLSQARISNLQKSNNKWLVLIIALGALAAFIALHLYSAEHLTRAPNSHWRLWEFGESFWIFPQLSTLNLQFQFIRVITLWGLLAYVLFFLNIKRYRNNYFILAGMLSPVVTILNPFFIDTFLRHYNSTTVWRLCYLIPVHFVAADLFIHYVKTFFAGNTFKKIFAGIVILLFVVLLLPFKNTWNGVHYSRAPTLKSSATSLSHQNYEDLLIFLERIDDSKRILTDPMTGYLVSGLTHHHSSRKKFFRNYRYKKFSFKNYENNPLDKYEGYFLIINLRPDSKSNVGQLAQHWSVNEWLNTKNYYPNELIEHVSTRPKAFEKVWEENKISVYKINASG